MQKQRSIKQKLLFVITQGTWGGAQRYVFDLATMSTKAYDVSVAVGEIEGKRDLQKKILRWNQEADSPIELIELSQLKRSISPIHDALAILELRSVYKKTKADIVHLNSTKAGIIGSYAKKGRCPALVYTVHGWVFLEPISKLRTRLYTYLERRTAKRKQALIVLSDEDRKTGEQIAPESKMHQIALGIDAFSCLSRNEARSHFTEQFPSLDITAPWVGTIANHYATKSLDTLIHAWKHVVKKHPKAQLLLIGDGPERAKLEALAKEQELDKHIFFAGSLPNAAKYLKALDQFVLTSKKEGLPYTLLEAAGAGVPIAATRVGGIPSVIEHTKTGLLMEPGDVLECARTLSYALDQREKMQACAERMKRSHSLTEMAEKTQEVYSHFSLPNGQSL